jgi:hypothetical protein
MAKVVITIKDLADGNIHVSTHYDPPLENDPDGETSPAEYASFLMLEALKREHKTENVPKKLNS